MEQAKLDNYRSTRGAEAYHQDHQRKLHRRVSDRRERRIFDRLFAALGPCRTILDMPCGFGRFFEMLSARGERVIEADVSEYMLQLSARQHAGRAAGFVQCSALDIPLADRTIDVVVSVRLNHHLDQPSERERHIVEMMRIADRAVIFTFFAHDSLKARLRRLRARFSSKREKYTLRSARVAELARTHGFEVRDAVPLSRLGSGHVYALLVRQ